MKSNTPWFWLGKIEMSYDVMAKTKTVIDDPLHLDSHAGRNGACIYWRLVVTWVLISAWIGLSMAGAQETGALESVASQLAAELVRYFPPVNGEVIKVDGNHIYIDLGAKDEVWTGLRLLVFREGEALKHPTTGEVVGHDELQLGEMTLVRLSENHAVGIHLTDDASVPVQPGDKVRLTAGRLDVSLVPPVGPLPANVSQTAVSAQLKDALEATGRFRVQGAERVNAWLLEHNVAPAAVVEPPYLQRLTKSFKTPYLVQPTLKSAQGQSLLALRLLAATQTEPVAVASAVLTAAGGGVASTLPPSAGAVASAPNPSATQDKFGGLFVQPLMAQPGGFPWNLAEGMTEIHHFDDILVGLDAGDPDGDGRVDVVMATESRISLYQLSGQKLQLVDEIKADRQGHFMSAQFVQLDAASPLGIVVNHQVKTDGVESFVLALQGQKLIYWQTRIYETLLAVDSNGDGVNDRIWAQTLDRARFFSRDAVRVYLPGNGKLQFQNNLKVPYALRATGAVLANLGTGSEAERHLVFVDERNHLEVYRGKDKLWQSSDTVGGSYAQAQLPQGGEMDVRIGDQLMNTFPFEPIPEPVDVDGDGVDEILVIRNSASLGGVVPNRARYTTGDIALLKAGPYGFTISPVSPKFDGMVSGVSVVPHPSPGVLIAISKRQGVFGNKQQTIIFLSHLPLS
jgi:hypothetical protein